MKKFFLCLAFFLLFILLSGKAFAANENFSDSAQVTYTVNASGLTHVVFAMSLTNKTDTYYASSYKIHLGFQDIQNVQAFDSQGSISPKVDKTNDGEDLSIDFNSHVFGKGRSLPFSFSFDTDEIASLNGSIWEVNIPGLSNADDFNGFSVHVVVPSYFGPPTYIKPEIKNNSLTFTKDELGKSGISLTFGDKQVYAFHLTYTLKNAEIFPVHTEIALPPNTSYQHVEIDSLSPHPTNVTMDADGNWLAQYFLKPSEVLKITASGKAFVSLTPSAEKLSQSDIKLYTTSTQYWQANNAKIHALANQLKTPEAIYEYVVHTLHYDFARVSDSQDRLGAVQVLAHPDEAVCLEFTDLFVAIMRAAGFPARELDGYGYTQNTSQRPLSLQKEVLHAWPEYYDMAKAAWIMVDPTWENTTGGVDYFHTFDFDHLALAIKGVSSTYPVPAGGYKLPGQEKEKDVLVTFAPQSVEPDPVVSALLSGPLDFTAGFPMGQSLEVRNTGNVLFPGQTVLAKDIYSKQYYTSQPIPPFGYVTIPMNFGHTSFLTNTKDEITIRFAGKTIAKRVRISVFSTPVKIVGGVILATILSYIIFIIARRARRVSISQ